ncbi:MAG: FhaA domain-containing protein [Pseudonocardiaceae bacterium]
MGKAQRFERRLQGMVGDAFARVFGGGVVPQEVAQGLQREAEDNARQLAGGRVLAPNRYTVTLGATDHARLAGDEQRVIERLQDSIRKHVNEHAWDTYGEVVVNLERSETLHTGQFRTSSSVDPDAPRTAGDGAMSQRPGQYPEDDPRGQYSQQDGYGYEQGQGGYNPDENYGRPYGGYDAQQGQGYHPDQGNPDQGNPDQGGYPQNYYGGYDPNYPAQGQPGHEQNYGQQYGYEPGPGQGGYGYDSGYAQGQHGPDQGADPNYSGPNYNGPNYNGPNYGEQNYGQYGGAQPRYGYEQGSGNPGYGEQNYNYGGPQAGYPADPGAQGYAPPAVQTGPRPLAASLHLDDGSNRSYQLIEGSNVVGRGQDAQFRLPDTGVSRRHLEITWDSQVAMLADLGSTNGTTVNGTPVQTWQLVDGDVIRVGHSSLVFRTQG